MLGFRALLIQLIELSVCAVFLCCKPAVAPTLLNGTWFTEQAGYQGRSLFISGAHVIFHSDNVTHNVHAISKVESFPTRGGESHLIHYVDGGDWPLRLLYKPGPPETLQIANRDAIWTRIQIESAAGGMK